MRVIRKLLVPTLLFFSVLMAAVVIYNAVSSTQQLKQAEQERLGVMEKTIQARVKAEEDFAVALAIESAQTPEIAKAFAEQDRARLQLLTYPSYQELNERFDIPQYQFHLAPAISFLRLHNLEAYGDDLSAFRSTVLKANEENRVVSGIEVGRAGLGIRGVSPVEYEGKPIGTVEFGLNLDKKLLETLKEEYGYDFQISISKEVAKISTLVAPEEYADISSENILILASTLDSPYLSGDDIYTQVLQGKEGIIEYKSINGRDYAIYTTPIIDFSGKVIGTLDIISDHTEVAQQQRQEFITSFGILLSILLIIGFGSAAIARNVLSPIGTLTNAANAIAAGNFEQNVEVESDDELGTLATAFNTMTAEIDENVRTLEDRVAARTKDQTTVAEIATEIAQIQNMDEMLARMVHLTQRGFGLYHAHVFTFDAENEGNELKIIACGYREGDEHEGTHGTSTIAYNTEHSIVARCARERDVIIVNDVHNSPDWLPNPLLPDTRSEMALPLLVGGQLLGVLDVQSETVNHFTEEDASVILTLAAQIAVAMQNLMQREEAQKIASDLGVVAEVSIASATIINQHDLLQKVVDLSKESFDLYHAHIYLLNDAGDTLELASGAGKIGREMVAEGLSIPLDKEQSLVAQAARTQQGLTVNDVTQTPNFLPNPRLPDTRAEMAVPMLVGGDVVGVLDVQSARIGRFKKLDVEVMTTLASQISIALQNVRYFENAQKQAEHEAKLNLISQKIQQADTVEKAMQIAARELGNALGKRKTMVALETSSLTTKKEA